ncbi:MAG: Tropinesterase [Devosia sp.]|nr:Tropinesterase [Devosia sp.]
MKLSRRNLIAVAFAFAAFVPVFPALGQAQLSSDSVEAGVATTARSSDGLQLSIMTYGDEDAPEILFLHGLGQSRLSWDKQIEDLSNRFRVVTFDLRGHGDSGKPEAASAYANASVWADDVDAVIKAAGLRRPTLVGWSFGGFVIGQYLEKYGSSHVAGVNLVDAVTKFDYALFGSSGLQHSPGLASPDLSVRTAAIVDFLAACFVQQPDPQTFSRMVAFNGMVPVGFHTGIGQLSAEGIDEAFAKVGNMLVTYGEQDTITAYEMSRRILDINTGATLSIYPEAGHAPFYDAPERFNEELSEFASR